MRPANFGGEEQTDTQSVKPKIYTSIEKKTINVQPPETLAPITNPKQRLIFSDSNIFLPSKRTKFSENLNFWRQKREPKSGDLAGTIFKLLHGLEGNCGSGGSSTKFEKYMKTRDGPQ